MTREKIFTRETRLWHPQTGWQTFPPGERDPGPAWFDVENGDVAAAAGPSAAALKDLAAAVERAEKAERKLADRQADMDRVAQERDDATAKVAGLERRADEAEKKLAEVEANVARIAAERDRAIENEANVRRELDEAKKKVAAKEEHIQVLETDLANAEAKLKAFDRDGDGKPGGSKPKAAKDSEA